MCQPRSGPYCPLELMLDVLFVDLPREMQCLQDVCGAEDEFGVVEAGSQLNDLDFQPDGGQMCVEICRREFARSTGTCGGCQWVWHPVYLIF